MIKKTKLFGFTIESGEDYEDHGRGIACIWDSRASELLLVFWRWGFKVYRNPWK